MHPYVDCNYYSQWPRHGNNQGPSLADWIKMWDIYTMGYYSAIRNDVMLPFMTTWMGS